MVSLFVKLMINYTAEELNILSQNMLSRAQKSENLIIRSQSKRFEIRQLQNKENPNFAFFRNQDAACVFFHLKNIYSYNMRQKNCSIICLLPSRSRAISPADLLSLAPLLPSKATLFRNYNVEQERKGRVHTSLAIRACHQSDLQIQQLFFKPFSFVFFPIFASNFSSHSFLF